MNARTADVVIVGGGVVGSAVAYFLAAEPAFDGRVVVVERDPTYRACSTSLSAGGIRQQFSTPENVAMSLFGIRFLREAARHLAVDGQAPMITLREQGYLFLATAAGRDVLAHNQRLQTQMGADIRWFEPAALGERFPWLATDDLVAGALGTSGEGWLDPFALLQGFRRKARALGVDYLQDEVCGIVRSGARVEAVGLRSGERLACAAVVNAAGPRAAAVARMAGIDDLPVASRKRCVFTFEAEPLPDCPLVVDPGGVYFRPEGQGYIAGVAPPSDPDCEDFTVEHALFEEMIWPALARRVPAFEALRPGAAWAGHYAYNVVDQNAILGPHPHIDNFYFANGFSGHGLQQSPAVGRYISELVSFGAARTLDLGAFSFERFAAGRMVSERNVV